MPIRSADYDPLMDELPPELAAEYKAEKRRQKMAELMSGQAMQPLQAPEVKGRFQGAISPLQGIAQLAQAYMAGKQLEGSDARMADIGARNQGLQAEAVAQYKRSTAGTPEMPMGPPTEEGAMGVQPAVTPDPQQRQQAIVDAITGANPRLAKLGQMDFQGDLATQTRKDAAQARIDQINQAERERRITKEEADVRRAEEAVKQDKRDKETKEYMLRVAASMRPARGTAAKAPSGYRYTVDDQLEAIPGGPADVKAEAARQKEIDKAVGVDNQLDSIERNVNKVLKDGKITKGLRSYVGQMDQYYPEALMASDTAAAGSALKSLQDQMTMVNLAAAKTAVGQSFGSMQVKEWEKFMNGLTNIGRGTPDAELESNLKFVNDFIKEKRDVLRTAISAGLNGPSRGRSAAGKVGAPAPAGSSAVNDALKKYGGG